MNIRSILLVFFAVLVAELAALGVLIGLIISEQHGLAETEKLRFRAFGAADELRQSSDDLTRMARTFASTGNPAFERYFQSILDIRDGNTPRPPNYQRVYWDFVVAGQDLPGAPTGAISLDAQLEALNLTAEEVKLLAEAKAKSDTLVSLENQAFKAVKGLFTEDGETVQRSPDLALARSLLFGDDYHAAKAEIMRPINDFLVAIEERMNAAVAERRGLLGQLETYSATVVGLSLLTFLALALILLRRVLGPIDLMVQKTEAIREGKYGDQVVVKSEDEIGVLAAALNRMSTAIAGDVAKRSESEAVLRRSKEEAEAAVAELREAQEQLVRNEAELSKNQDILQGLADNLPEFVSVKDPEGRYIFVNRKYEEWSATSRDQFIGKTLFDVYDAELAQAINARDQIVVDSQSPQSDESTRTYPDGVTRTVLRTRVPVTSKTGDFLGVATVNHDITDRKREEAIFRQSEAQFRSVFETDAAGMALLTMEGMYFKVNRRFCDIVGYDEQELLKMNWRDITFPDDIAAVEALDEQVSEKKRSDFMTERRLMRKNGTNVWTSLSSAQLHDEAGNPRQIFSFVQDISELKNAEEELNRQRINTRDVLENVAQGIVKWDANRRLVVANQHYRELLNLPDHLMTEGRPLKEITHFIAERGDYGEGDPNELADERIAFLYSGEVHRSELTIGGASTYYVVIQPTDDGGVIITYTDITERKLGEEELRLAKERAESMLTELQQTQARLVTTEKMASLGQLTAGIAHEIKNPLNFVNNFSETSVELLDELKEVVEPVQEHLDEDDRDDVEDLFETLKGDLQKIHHHGSRADGIVKSMLLHARGDSSEHVTTEINGLVDEALQLAYHGERARDKGFQVTLDQRYGKDVGKADIVPQDVTRVLVNLLSNAFYAVKKRTADEISTDYVPTVSVTTAAEEGEIEIRVRDNGTGMPKEVREKLFEPFFTTKPTGAGTGLGLSMCFDIIVQQHGGQIEVDSALGEFTEFMITLPRRSANGEKHSGSEA